MRSFGLARAVCAVLIVSACGKNDEDAPSSTAARPLLTLDAPAAADWLPAGTIDVSGRAEGVTDVRVNGQPAERQGAHYSAPLLLQRGINMVEARAYLDAGHETYLRRAVIAGDFADPGAHVDRALSVRVNRGGLDRVMDEVGAMLDVGAIQAALTASNPVYEDAYGIFGWDAVEVAADLGTVWFEPPVLTAEPATDVLTVAITLPGLDVWVPVRASILGWDVSVDVRIGADEAIVTGLLTVDAIDGKVSATLADADVRLVGFWYDTSLLPGEIEQFILVDTVRTALEDTLVAQIETMVPPLVEDQLAALDLALETEVLGKAVSVRALVDTASIDRDGLVVVADLDVDMPGAGTHPYAGYLSAGASEATPDRTRDIGVTMSDDLLNRILFEAWRAGVLSLELRSADGDLDPALLSQLGAEDEASVRIDARLPPVIVERDGRLQAQVGELDVTVLTPGGHLGERLDLAVGLFVGLDLRIADGELLIDLVDPAVDLVVRDSDWGVAPSTISTLLADQLPLGALLLLLGDLAIPLPTLAGVTIDTAEVARDGSGVSTGVAIELR